MTTTSVLTPPGPRTRLPAGSLLAFSRDPLGFLYALAMEHGDVARFRAGPRDVHLLSHPDLIHHVLVADPGSFRKDRGLEMAKALLGEGLLTSEGELHRRQRRLAQPAFHRERIAQYAGAMVRRALARETRWRDGAAIDVGRERMSLALEIVAETLFGTAVSDGDIAAISAALDDAMSTFTMARIRWFELLDRLPLPSTLRMRRARARLDRAVYAFIAARRASGEDRGDLLSMLLLARDEEGTGGMTDLQLRDEVMTLFLAGHETTANALTWTFYLLGRHPEAEARLHRELDEVLGDRAPSLEDLPRLVYAERAVRESMRLYPPAWAVARRALAPFTVRGYAIPRGSTVLLSQWVMHHHPAWFADPFRFDPDRWTAEFRAALPRLAYFPFGAGPRICIGESFAWTEAVLVLATLARRWRVVVDPRPVDPVARVTLRPGRPVRAVLRSRGR